MFSCQVPLVFWKAQSKRGGNSRILIGKVSEGNLMLGRMGSEAAWLQENKIKWINRCNEDCLDLTKLQELIRLQDLIRIGKIAEIAKIL